MKLCGSCASTITFDASDDRTCLHCYRFALAHPALFRVSRFGTILMPRRYADLQDPAELEALL